MKSTIDHDVEFLGDPLGTVDLVPLGEIDLEPRLVCEVWRGVHARKRPVDGQSKDASSSD